MKHRAYSSWIFMLVLLFPLMVSCETRVVGGTAKDYFGDTKEALLARAAAEGNVATVKQLVQQGANANAVGDKNMSPLGWALAAKSVTGMRALLDAGADPNQPIGPEHEIHLVWLAAGLESSDTLRVLLSYRGNPDAKHDGLSFNAMRRAVMHPNNMRLLVEAGADVNADDGLGFGVALIAANLAQFEVVDYLLEHGYRRDLPLLAWAVGNRDVSESFRPKKQKTMEILRSMGFSASQGKPPKMEGITPLP
ncbi:ankyrin repeat domain-containing protein [Pandoraea pnomenusa]|uniref:ankyrin repeat domain-containing protein n=1 Tax=Pandoraea pnomenusa TaxID=93220 RepID=UPI003CE8C046